MNNKKKILVTLTSIPPRLINLPQVIDKIFNQSIYCDKIYLNIPHTYKNNVIKIPQVLNEYLLLNDHHKRVFINRCYDYGPITKLIPTLDFENGDDFLFIVDDDMLLEFDAFDTLLKKFCDRKAFSFSGWNVGGKWNKFQLILNNFQDEEVDWIQAASIILCQPNYFDKKMLMKYDKDEKYKELFMKNDDHWISYHLELKNIKRISINQHSFNFMKHINYPEAISYSKTFLKEVYQICEYLKEKGIYYHTSKSTVSIGEYLIFITLIFLIYYYTKNYKLLLFCGIFIYQLLTYASISNSFKFSFV